MPDLPGDLLFSDGELRVATFARPQRRHPRGSGTPFWWPASAGGSGAHDPPGAQLLWHGYTQLVAMAFAFELRGIRMNHKSSQQDLGQS